VPDDGETIGIDLQVARRLGMEPPCRVPDVLNDVGQFCFRREPVINSNDHKPGI
jgi:hypothetical protein